MTAEWQGGEGLFLGALASKLAFLDEQVVLIAMSEQVGARGGRMAMRGEDTHA
ncbi:MAG: hypothetical protein ABSF36_03325 [Candidatus Methanomethylicaceae archaeon]